MLIFLDTDFTDFIDCDLISIEMVTEDGKHAFYAERSDYIREWESDFVRMAVLPYLGQIPDAACSRIELKQRLWNWFSAMPDQVQNACDSAHDRDLHLGCVRRWPPSQSELDVPMDCVPRRDLNVPQSCIPLPSAGKLPLASRPA